MALANKESRQSTIKFIEQGKEWQGKNGGQKMQEYKLEMANGDMPVFNIPSNSTFPYQSRDTIVYLLTEREINGKINQYASVDKIATENLNRPMENQLPTKEESIALAVALKEASNLVTSDIWQKCNSLKKDEDIIAAKDKILKETVTVAGLMYKVLIAKPQNNE